MGKKGRPPAGVSGPGGIQVGMTVSAPYRVVVIPAGDPRLAAHVTPQEAIELAKVLFQTAHAVRAMAGNAAQAAKGMPA